MRTVPITKAWLDLEHRCLVKMVRYDYSGLSQGFDLSTSFYNKGSIKCEHITELNLKSIRLKQ